MPILVTDVNIIAVQVISDVSISFDSESEDHKQLLNRGLVVIEESRDGGWQHQHSLIIAAPLLASAALCKHRELLQCSNVK